MDHEQLNVLKHCMPSAKRLEELIDEATIDCCGEDEQHTGLLTMNCIPCVRPSEKTVTNASHLEWWYLGADPGKSLKTKRKIGSGGET